MDDTNNVSNLSVPFIGEQQQQQQQHNNNDGNHNTTTRRLLDRNGTFHQSRGHWGIQRLTSGQRHRHYTTTTNHTNAGGCCRGRAQTVQSLMRSLWEDWFHSLAHRPTIQLMCIIFLSYILLVFGFAYIYLGVSMLGIYFMNHNHGDTDDASSHDVVDNFCGMDITNHMEALYFSLSTMTTIGYGVSDYYFGDCWTPLLLVLWQSCCAITFQSVAIGLLFQRISRGQKRGKSIVFSNQACVRTVQGIPHVLLRIGELRKHSLIDVKVKVFCIKHERYYHYDDNNHHHHSEEEEEGERDDDDGIIETAHFVTHHVPLCYPQEEINSHLFLNVPQVICHRMIPEENSPLVPKGEYWYDGQGTKHTSSSSSSSIHMYHKDRNVELIVQVEGTDELTGQRLQAKHSYLCATDLVWNATFVPCCIQPPSSSPNNNNDDDDDARPRRRRWRCRSRQQQEQSSSSNHTTICHVDFSKFHNVVSVPLNVQECPYVPRTTMTTTRTTTTTTK